MKAVRADGPDGERYGPLFWGCLAVGWGVMAFGVWGVFKQASATRPLAFGAYVVGAAVVHDALVAPLVCLGGWLVARRAGEPARPAIRFGLVLTGVTVLFSVPFVAGWGRLPDNPSLLPSNYALGLMAVLIVVWSVTGALLLLALRRRAS